MLGTAKAWEQFDILEENYYNPKNKAPRRYELIALVVIEAQKLIEIQKPQIEETKPKADFFDVVEMAKMLLRLGKCQED